MKITALSLCKMILCRTLMLFCTLSLIGTILLAGRGTGLARTLEVTDQAGRRVRVDQPVKRVVTTFIPATLFALCSGLGDALAGASDKDGTASVYEALIDPKNPPVLVGNRSAGISLETVFSLRPDLVILYGQKDGVRLADRFTALGIPAIVILPESLFLTLEALDLIGRASGRTAHTDRVADAMKQIRSGITQRLKGIDRPHVYYAGSSLFSTVSGGMLQTEMIDLAGGINVSRNTRGFFVTISPEQLLSWNPEVIIASDRLSPEDAPKLASPELAGLRAVRSRRIFRVPAETYWDFPSPLAMAGVLWMAGKLHPEHFPEKQVHREIQTYYDTLFGPGFSEKHPEVLGNAAPHDR